MENDNDHYFHDSDGHLWVDVTAVNNADGFEILPVSNGTVEVKLPLTQFRVTKTHPCLQAVLTSEADSTLASTFSE